MCTSASCTIDPASRDILAAARAASRKLRDGKRNEVNEAQLAAALAEFEATVLRILDRQRALEERQRILEQRPPSTSAIAPLLRAQQTSIAPCDKQPTSPSAREQRAF
jgi:hypothetical protein